MCVIKSKFKFKNYKDCLEATQLKNKINYLKKKKKLTHNLKRDYKEFIRNNRLILETQ